VTSEIGLLECGFIDSTTGPVAGVGFWSWNPEVFGVNPSS